MFPKIQRRHDGIRRLVSSNRSILTCIRPPILHRRESGLLVIGFKSQSRGDAERITCGRVSLRTLSVYWTRLEDLCALLLLKSITPTPYQRLWNTYMYISGEWYCCVNEITSNLSTRPSLAAGPLRFVPSCQAAPVQLSLDSPIEVDETSLGRVACFRFFI